MPVSEFEVRSVGPSTRIFEGHAAVYGQEAEIAGLFRETVEDVAFNRTLKANPTVDFLFDHDGMTLASTRSKPQTLRLASDSVGLHVEAEIDLRMNAATDVAIAAERGDLTSMSYAFYTPRGGDVWDDDPEDGGLPKRSLREVSLNNGDVSAVKNPAYAGATGGIRSDVLMMLESRGVKLRSLNPYIEALELVVHGSEHDPDEVRAAIEVLEALIERPVETTQVTPGPVPALDLDAIRARQANRKRRFALIG